MKFDATKPIYPSRTTQPPRRAGLRSDWSLRLYGDATEPHPMSEGSKPPQQLVCLCKPDGTPLGGLVDSEACGIDVDIGELAQSKVGDRIEPGVFFKNWVVSDYVSSNYRMFRKRCIYVGAPADILPIDFKG